MSASPNPNIGPLSFAGVFFGRGFQVRESSCDLLLRERWPDESWLTSLTRKSQIRTPAPGAFAFYAKLAVKRAIFSIN